MYGSCEPHSALVLFVYFMYLNSFFCPQRCKTSLLYYTVCALIWWVVGLFKTILEQKRVIFFMQFIFRTKCQSSLKCETMLLNLAYYFFILWKVKVPLMTFVLVTSALSFSAAIWLSLNVLLRLSTDLATTTLWPESVSLQDCVFSEANHASL